MSNVNPLNLGGPVNKNCIVNNKSQHTKLVSLVQYINEHMPVDELVYKGGLFLSQHTGVARYTQDVDVSIVNDSLYIDFRKVLANYGDLLIERGEIKEYSVKEVVESHMSGGAKYIAPNGAVYLSIDISLRAESFESIAVRTQEFGQIYISSIEQIIADKLTVMFTRSRFRRAKDLYDLWLIVNNCTWDDTKVLNQLIAYDKYPLLINCGPFRQDCILEMEKAYNKLVVRDPITEVIQNKPAFLDIVEKVSDLMTKFMESEN